MACLVVFMHRENLKRLTEGTESKLYFSKAKREEAKAAAAARAAAAERQPDPVLLSNDALGKPSKKNKK